MNAVARTTNTAPRGDIAAADTAKAYRISKKLEKTLRRIAEGWSQTRACQDTGMSLSGLSLALKKPHIIERRDALVAETLRSRGIRALGRIDELSAAARSEYVKLEASKDLADRAGYQPVKQTHQGDTALIVNIRIDTA